MVNAEKGPGDRNVVGQVIGIYEGDALGIFYDVDQDDANQKLATDLCYAMGFTYVYLVVYSLSLYILL